MKKMHSVGITYMTRKGNIGARSYRILAETPQEALEIGRKRAEKPGRSRFQGDAVEIPEHSFQVIPLNLQQGMIRATDVPKGTVNQIVAIYSYHAQKLLISVGWRSEEEAIRAACPVESFIVQYADSFHIDSWDGKLNKP